MCLLGLATFIYSALSSEHAVCFLLNKALKIHLPAGPAKKICQQSAIGKLRAAVCRKTLTKPASWYSLNRKVATKLIAGHIRQTVRAQRASSMKKNGISSVTTRLVSIITGFSIMNISKIMATGHMMISS
jgi:hypothetical protein